MKKRISEYKIKLKALNLLADFATVITVNVRTAKQQDSSNNLCIPEQTYIRFGFSIYTSQTVWSSNFAKNNEYFPDFSTQHDVLYGKQRYIYKEEVGQVVHLGLAQTFAFDKNNTTKP